jgi:hypothetical protein
VSGFRLRSILGDKTDTSPIKRSIKVGPPRPRGADLQVQPRNVALEDFGTIFIPDSPGMEWDTLTAVEKAQLEFFARHEIPEHDHQVCAALEAYYATGAVDHLDRAISILMHLRKFKHPND